MKIKFYITPDGKVPYTKWFNSLKDKNVKSKIQERLIRVSLGNFGDYENLKGGLYELRFKIGIRIYYTLVDNELVILFCGGTKNTKGEQQGDIAKARKYLSQL